MTLVDDIEFYGRAVDAGELTRQRAIELLVENSKGGLTIEGAAGLVDTWTTARARYGEGARHLLLDMCGRCGRTTTTRCRICRKSVCGPCMTDHHHEGYGTPADDRL